MTAALLLIQLLGPILGVGSSAFALQESCKIPLREWESAPATDLIQDGIPADRDRLLDQIRAGLDSSQLEPQKSRIYTGEGLSLSDSERHAYPEADQTLEFLSTLPGTDGLVRARVRTADSREFQMNLSLDSHAALARTALLRKLGYAVASPRHYGSLKVRFPDLKTRDQFLDTIASETLTARGRWISGGLNQLSSTLPEVVLQDLVLEPSRIEVPQLHWGILTPEFLASRRTLRSLIVPLTLLDIPESVNMYSFEPAKEFNGALVLNRTNASAFQDETSIGDARWIARKIARLSRADWGAILRVGAYPADIEALLLEKTLGRVNQMMALLAVKDFKAHSFNTRVSIGKVVKGKATQESYPGYALRFTYGDPESPLRASELLRFAGVSLINSGLGALLEKANEVLQLSDPASIIKKHSEATLQAITDHYQNHPEEPYIQPLSVWGGPVGGARVQASRNIMTGTYYGSESRIQLVDVVGASVNVGGFFGLSGAGPVGISAAPSIQVTRNYVHVRPLADIKTAWKDNWSNLLVPKFMQDLSHLLGGQEPAEAQAALKTFMERLTPGELFIVTDGFSGGAGVQVQIPVGALLGIAAPVSSLSVGAGVSGNYGILSRTTLLRTQDGIQVLISRIRSGAFEAELSVRFFIDVAQGAIRFQNGTAHTRAFLLPEKGKDELESQSIQRSLLGILRRNNPEVLEEEFKPFELDHRAKGNRSVFRLGPWSWTRRVNTHQLEITPPEDPEGRYRAEDHKRTVVDGQFTRIAGSDYLGFLGGLGRLIHPLLNIGPGGKGDDPAANFLGTSRTFQANTQIEVTPGRDHRPFLRIQEIHSGWSMRVKRLLRLLRKLSDELEEFNPGGGIVNPAEFSQTKRIQAFQLSWNLLIHPAGIDRILKILDIRNTPTKDAAELMIAAMGAKSYRAWCKDHDLEPTIRYGMPSMDELGTPGSGVLAESSQGKMAVLGCVTPFMETLFDLRGAYRNKQALFQGDTSTVEDAKEKVRLLNRAMNEMNKDLSLAEMIRLIGKEDAFFQIRVSGFRTRDENGDSEYFSHSLGRLDPEMVAGPLSDIAQGSGISSNEIEARYLSNGY
jgi:hypothetical protein